jgi:hypothetical protein
MHYFDNFLLLKQCYFDEKYSELYRVRSTARENGGTNLNK